MQSSKYHLSCRARASEAYRQALCRPSLMPVAWRIHAHSADDTHQGFPMRKQLGTGTAASRRSKEAADAQPPSLGGKSALESLWRLLQRHTAQGRLQW